MTCCMDDEREDKIVELNKAVNRDGGPEETGEKDKFCCTDDVKEDEAVETEEAVDTGGGPEVTGEEY